MRKIRCPHCGTEFDLDESDYSSIVQQVRDHAFQEELARQTALVQSDLESKQKMNDQASASKIHELELQLQHERENAVSIRQTAEADKRAAVEQAKLQSASETESLKEQLQNERNKNSLLVSQNELEKTNQQKVFDAQLRMKDEQIEYYKDFKARQSTKEIGESLEQYCWREFNKYRAAAFPTAYFEKDNEVSKQSGSKGDFIFRDSSDGMEYISIMFEMKNESDSLSVKHKNEDFFKELDKDRREKHCEYAVLVSMLERDNDLYNQGIVDVSYRYPKMYVIRPQFFIPLITLLRNAALQSVESKRELVRMQNENLDVTHFMENLDDFKQKFARNYTLAGQRFKDAIDNIDKTIIYLQKVRDALTVSEKHLTAANNQAQALTVQKLTKNAPSVAEKFEEAGGQSV